MLARHNGPDLPGAKEIADAIGAPRNYLSKTLNTLVRHRILTSVRGPRGGFALSNTPENISVADVVDVFSDKEPRFKLCMLGNTVCNPEYPCAAHECWIGITTRARKPLMRTTIAELCGMQTESELSLVADHAGETSMLDGRKFNSTGPKP